MFQLARGNLQTTRDAGLVIRRLTVMGICIALGMFALGAFILVDMREDTWGQAEQASNNLVLALTRDITRNITLYDRSLQGAIAAASRPDLSRLTPETRQSAIFDGGTGAEYMGSMLLVDANGNIIEDSTAIPPHQANLSDREHFRVQQQNPDAGLFISRPIRSRLRDGEWLVALTRRVSRPDGTFGGIAVGALRLAYSAIFLASWTWVPMGPSHCSVRTDGSSCACRTGTLTSIAI